MGGLLAILLSIKYKRQVKGLVLLAVPLKVFVRGSMVCNGGKVLLRKVEEDDVVASYAKNALSVARGSFCTYMGWIPRYMELLPMIRVVKEQLGRIEVPALIVQSRNDELVSNESIKVYKERLRNEYRIVQLLKSHHFYYDRSELAYVLKEFAVFIDKEKEDRCH